MMHCEYGLIWAVAGALRFILLEGLSRFIPLTAERGLAGHGLNQANLFHAIADKVRCTIHRLTRKEFIPTPIIRQGAKYWSIIHRLTFNKFIHVPIHHPTAITKM